MTSYQCGYCQSGQIMSAVFLPQKSQTDRCNKISEVEEYILAEGGDDETGIVKMASRFINHTDIFAILQVFHSL
jgi:aerobic-type carbon monoxide dehydrogenase small subunit (CoxS/CutS family)